MHGFGCCGWFHVDQAQRNIHARQKHALCHTADLWGDYVVPGVCGALRSLPTNRDPEVVFFLELSREYYVRVYDLGRLHPLPALAAPPLFNHGSSSFCGVSTTKNPFGVIGLLCLPHSLVYGLLLPMLGAVVRKESTNQCLYRSDFWAWTDNMLFFSGWALLLVLSTFVKDIKDGYGEVRNLRRALNLSLCTLAVTVVVEVLQIDGLALGRAIVTSSVLASVCIFFVRQNGEELRRLLFRASTLEYVQQDQAISDAVLREKNSDSLDSDEESSVASCLEKCGSQLSSTSKSRVFARTLLNNN